MYNKEDRAEVTLGISIKIPHEQPLDLSPIWLGRTKMFLKFIFLCLQSMVSGQQVEYIIIPRRRFGGIFIEIPKVTSARSSLLHTPHFIG